jgi:hypothetical protein
VCFFVYLPAEFFDLGLCTVVQNVGEVVNVTGGLKLRDRFCRSQYA